MRVLVIPDTELKIAVEIFPHRLAMESFLVVLYTQ
jgi:hypothetical protein